VGLSCGDLVLVYESRRGLVSAIRYSARLIGSGAGISLGRCELAESTVRAGRCCSAAGTPVSTAQVVLADDQQPVEEPRRRVR